MSTRATRSGGKRALEAPSAPEPAKKKQAKTTATPSKAAKPAKPATRPAVLPPAKEKAKAPADATPAKATKAKATTPKEELTTIPAKGKSKALPKAKASSSKAGKSSGGPPLATLLSQLYVALSSEADNEFESNVPHTTSNHPKVTKEAKSQRRPWLTSIAMYYNCLRDTPSKGSTTYGELRAKAKTDTAFHGMWRWGYLHLEDDKFKTGIPKPDVTFSLTKSGLMAKDAWKKLLPEMEYKWNSRYGAAIRGALWGLVRQFDDDFPDCLPILTHGYASRETYGKIQEGSEMDGSEGMLTLLAKVLLKFSKEFERDLIPSLSMCANFIRPIYEAQGNSVHVNNLHVKGGVGKAATENAIKSLQKTGLATQTGAGREKYITLTAKGKNVAEEYFRRLQSIEEDWSSRYGDDVIQSLKDGARKIVEKRNLMEEMNEGYDEVWRKLENRKADTLPHYPLVTHRGGYPDGS